jgi:hypothetical protein
MAGQVQASTAGHLTVATASATQSKRGRLNQNSENLVFANRIKLMRFELPNRTQGAHAVPVHLTVRVMSTGYTVQPTTFVLQHT